MFVSDDALVIALIIQQQIFLKPEIMSLLMLIIS